jgi:hypothetical protein
MDTYKLFNDRRGQAVSVLKNGSVSIPFDPDNRDYIDYLKWLSEGNEPLPADEGESN